MHRSLMLAFILLAACGGSPPPSPIDTDYSECPEPSDPCINPQNYEECTSIVDTCPGELRVIETCPYTFECAE